MGAADGFHAVHGTQIARVTLHQGGWQQAKRQQVFWPIDVGHHAVKQVYTLLDADLDGLPGLRRQNQWKEVQRPGALGPTFIRVDVVGDAIVPNLACQTGGTPIQVAQAIGFNVVKKLLPGRRESRRASAHLVKMSGDCGAGL